MKFKNYNRKVFCIKGLEKNNAPVLFNRELELNAERDVESLICLHGVYFHGFCDEYDDLVYYSPKDVGFFLPENSGKSTKCGLRHGVYDVVVYGEPAKLFYWLDYYFPRNPKGRGLVVQVNSPWYKDAERKFKTQQSYL